MKNYIIKRCHIDGSNPFMAKIAAKVVQSLIISNGYGLATELLRNEWNEITLNTLFSMEIIGDLIGNLIECSQISETNLNISNEIFSIIDYEIKEVLKVINIRDIAFVQFRPVDKTSFCPKFSITIGFM